MNSNDLHPYQAQIDQLEAQIAENQALLADPELGQLAQAEIDKLSAQKKQLTEAAAEYQQAISDDETDAAGSTHVNCILELRPGAGGDEAKIWATDLLRMYTRFADTMGFKIEMIDDLIVKIKGKTSQFLPQFQAELADQPELQAQFEAVHPDFLETQTAYDLFRFELGVHRVQRVPVTESQGRIHTSTASVAVLPEVSARAVEIKEEDLDWQFMRASGAGGQSVNKTNSAVRLTHQPSGIVVVSRQERKQAQNRSIALELLRAQLWEIEEEKRQAKLGKARQAIGRNMRAEKIRTYNYPQNRVTDHRIKESWHSLEAILDGQISDVVWAMTKTFIVEKNNQTEAEPSS